MLRHSCRRLARSCGVCVEMPSFSLRSFASNAKAATKGSTEKRQPKSAKFKQVAKKNEKSTDSTKYDIMLRALKGRDIPE
jgi:hypothetical protein